MILLSTLLALLLSTTSHAGFLTAPVKIAEKIAAHSADNVIEHVVTHSADNVVEHAVASSADNAVEHVVANNADDAATLAVKTGSRVSLASAPKVAKVIDTSMDIARTEAQAAKPLVKEIHRIPIPKPRSPTAEMVIKTAPKLAVGVGAGAGIAVGVHNVTAGIRERQESIGEAEKEAILNDPSLLPTKWDHESSFWNTLARGCNVSLILIGAAVPLWVFLGWCARRRATRPSRESAGEEPSKSIA